MALSINFCVTGNLIKLQQNVMMNEYNNGGRKMVDLLALLINLLENTWIKKKIFG